MLKQYKRICIRIASYVLILDVLTGQNIPVPMNHPINDFILRLYTQNIIHEIHPGMRPFSVDQINQVLDEVSSTDQQLSTREKSLVLRFKKEFAVNEIKQGLKGPWQSKHISTAVHTIFKPFDTNDTETRFLSYHDDDLLMWTDWEEFFAMDFQDTLSRSSFTDRVTISGKFDNNLSFYSRYTLYRVSQTENLPLPDEYKQGYVLEEDNTDWLVWDVSEASIRFDNSIINAEISKIPIYWGFSKKHSPILSTHVQSFSFIRFSKEYKRIRAQSFLGSLVPYGDNRKGIIEEKHIAAHRFEFDLTPSLTVSFNEMVIYARQNIELGYLLPVNLLWSEEHGLGNRDNVLMSFDAQWSVKPGLSLYGTFFWDELSWFKLFSPWWGNKFIFQSGFHWVPFSNPQLPDFRVEFTASRPWVYTHQDSLLNYTSAAHGLGFPIGPNAQMFYLEMNMWPTFKTFLSLNVSYLKKGTEMGSDPNDNYSLRNEELDDKTPMLMGEINERLDVGLNIEFRMTELLYIKADISYNDETLLSGQWGLLVNF